jgi:hypothetical protein
LPAAEEIGKFEVFVAQAVFAEVADQLAQLDAGDLALADPAGEVDVLQHVVQAGVCRLNAGERLVQEVPYILMCLIDEVVVARQRRHPEGTFFLVPARVLRRLLGLCLVLAALHFKTDDFLMPLIEYIRAALQEQHAEDVLLELGSIHLAAQNVGGLEEVAFQLG